MCEIAFNLSFTVKPPEFVGLARDTGVGKPVGKVRGKRLTGHVRWPCLERSEAHSLARGHPGVSVGALAFLALARGHSRVPGGVLVSTP